MVQIQRVTSEPGLSQARDLFREYASSLSFSLCFQGFEEELATLPGAYAPPGGLLLLAYHDGDPSGCCAYRALEPGVCEMKRLYVRPAKRGLRIGRLLACALIDEARRSGYRMMKLDTIETMVEAIGLYRSLGFRETGPYTPNPIPGARYFALDLAEDVPGDRS